MVIADVNEPTPVFSATRLTVLRLYEKGGFLALSILNSMVLHPIISYTTFNKLDVRCCSVLPYPVELTAGWYASRGPRGNVVGVIG